MFSLRYHQEKKEFEQNVGEHFSYQTSKLTSAIVYGLRVMIFHLAVAMNDESGGVGGGGGYTHTLEFHQSDVPMSPMIQLD